VHDLFLQLACLLARSGRRGWGEGDAEWRRRRRRKRRGGDGGGGSGRAGDPADADMDSPPLCVRERGWTGERRERGSPRVGEK
jgi:hypothetical protein